MRDLKFIGPTSLPTPGRTVVTVRVGHKWNDLVADDEVRVLVCDSAHAGECQFDEQPTRPACIHYGTAVIQEVWSGYLADLPARLVSTEHEPACRDFSGLVDTLSHIYGVVNEHTWVVAIAFRLPLWGKTSPDALTKASILASAAGGGK